MELRKFIIKLTYSIVLFLSLSAAAFFAVAWHLRLVPLETAWGDWGTWAGAIGTIAGFAVAIATLWHNEKARRQADIDDRTAQARRVGVTSMVRVEQAPAPWQSHQAAWTGGRAIPNLPSAEEQEHLDSYSGPWLGKVTYTVYNGSPFPLFNPIVTGDITKISPELPAQPTKTTRLPALLPGSTTSGTWSIDLRIRPEEDMTPDLVELQFSDVWGDRWRSTSQGTDKV